MMHLLPTLLIIASTPERTSIDAFLADHTQRAVVDPRELTAEGQRTLSRSVISAVEPRFGVPTFLWAARPADGTRSYRAMGLSAEQAAHRYLLTYAELYRASATAWSAARASHVHDLGDGGAVIVTFEQQVKGVRVFRDELKVIMNAQLELVALSGYLTPQLARRGAFQLSAASAVASAYANLTGTGLDPASLTALEDQGGYSRFTLAALSRPARVRPAWFALGAGLEPAFAVELEQGTDENPLYSMLISARDGAVLSKHSLTASDAFSYRVWADPVTHFPSDGPQGTTASPHPTGKPDGFRPAFVPSVLISLQNGPISTNDPWLAPGSNRTIGNNARAFADLKKPDGYGPGDASGDPSAAGTFDYAYDLNAAAGSSPTQQEASITQLFYTANFLHDWYYDVGFDEKSGNAQTSNLGRGGLGNDELELEALDFAGTDNSNMSTPADGSPPRMRMYVWSDFLGLKLSVASTPAQDFGVGGATFGPQVYSVAAPLQLAQAASGTGSSTACGAVKSLAGKIAIIDRGTCTFVIKVLNAQNAGALGVVIADNVDEGGLRMSGTSTTITIPSVAVTLAQGDTLKTLEGTSATLSARAPANPDGSLDGTIVAHEWGHYIAHRLIGNANGLGNLQAGGMGEGWSDFHALLLIVRGEDKLVANNTHFEGVYTLAGYAFQGFHGDPYYYGVRRVPYSTDLTKNGLSFRHIQPNVTLPDVPTAYGKDGSVNDEVHSMGEVWGTMLWECYAALLGDSRYTFDQARDRMRGYIVAAYKATPLLPTYLEARDALLAVTAAKDLADYALFWKAFAKRGAGVGATGPERDSPDNTPVVESTAVGNSLLVTGITLDDTTTSCDHDGNLDANEAGFANVTVLNVGIGTVAAAQLTLSTPIGQLTFPSGATLTVPSVDPYRSTVVKVPVALGNVAGVQLGVVNASVADASLVKSPTTLAAPVRLNYDLVPGVSRSDDVEAPMSQWSTGSAATGNAGSPFRIYADTPDSHWWYGPSSPFSADTYLISPPLTVSTGEDFVFTFKHRYDFEFTADTTTTPPTVINYDGAVIELSTDDGATWNDIGASATPGYPGLLNAADGQSSNPLDGQRAFVGLSAGYPAFVLETVNLHTQLAGKTVRVRFHQATDDANGNKGWELDDLAFSGITNRPFTAIVSDPNTCSNKAPMVTVGADQEVLEGAKATLTATASDPDGDPLTSTWTQVSGPLVTLDANHAFTAPATRSDLLLIFELTVSDGRAVVGPLTQKVLVKTSNHAPVASVTPTSLTVNQQAPVSLAGSATDADGDPLTYLWTQVSGPEVAFADATAATVTFTAPKVDADATIELQFVASDTGLASTPVAVEVKVKKGCGCSSFEGSLIGLAGLLTVLRRRRSR